jgi:hypothetical protein
MTKCRPKTFIYAILLGVMLSAGTESATAKVLRWELQNVKFQDGNAASGFFDFDTDSVPRLPIPGSTRPLLAWDITVHGAADCSFSQGGAVTKCFPDYRFSSDEGTVEYSGVASDRGEGDLIIIYSHKFYDFDPVGRVSLRLILGSDSHLSNAGGTLSLGGSEDWTYPGTVFRYIASGQVVAIPEPSETVFLAVYLIGMVAFCVAQALKK